jgi:hypothetical protein
LFVAIARIFPGQVARKAALDNGARAAVRNGFIVVARIDDRVEFWSYSHRSVSIVVWPIVETNSGQRRSGWEWQSA